MLKKIQTLIDYLSITRIALKLDKAQKSVDVVALNKAQNFFDIYTKRVKEKDYHFAQDIDNAVLYMATITLAGYLEKNNQLDKSTEVIESTLKIGKLRADAEKSLKDTLRARNLIDNIDTMTVDEIRDARIYFAKRSLEDNDPGFAKFNVSLCHFALGETDYAKQRYLEISKTGLNISLNFNSSRTLEKYVEFIQECISASKPARKI